MLDVKKFAAKVAGNAFNVLFQVEEINGCVEMLLGEFMQRFESEVTRIESQLHSIVDEKAEPEVRSARRQMWRVAHEVCYGGC